MLFKILAFLAVLIAIYLIFFKTRVKGGAKKEDKDAENFVECKKCGTFIEAKDAVISGGGYVCEDCIKDRK
nr:PP0621 family protein [uncultured Campylobacter sp.]